MNAIIEIEELYKVYQVEDREVRAVDGVTLSIGEGEFTAVSGSPGSGKATLLHLAGGLDAPTSGRLRVGGVDISLLSGSRLAAFRLRHIGFVFEAYSLIPVLTAKENVALVLELQGLSKGEIGRRAAELLQAVGLGDCMDSRPARLSGGQQQRVAVARALASALRLVLACEPAAGLDEKSAQGLLSVMERLNRQEGATFIFFTRDPRIMAKARRIITLESGKVVSDALQ